MQVNNNPYTAYQANSINRPQTLPAPQKPEVLPTPDPKEPDLKNDDELRQAVVAYAGYQSKMTQAEIYIKGSTGESVNLTDSVDTLVEGYAQAKKQNDAIAAYSNQ